MTLLTVCPIAGPCPCAAPCQRMSRVTVLYNRTPPSVELGEGDLPSPSNIDAAISELDARLSVFNARRKREAL